MLLKGTEHFWFRLRLGLLLSTLLNAFSFDSFKDLRSGSLTLNILPELCLMALPPAGLVEMLGYPLPLARLGV